MLDVALLGTGGMMPLPNRFLTAFAVRQNGRILLIDCGEGTQVTQKMLGWGFKTVDVICLTHFHADHAAGIPGFLLSMANSDKGDPLTIIGPVGTEYIVKSLLVIAKDLPFEINFVELPYEKKTYHINQGGFSIGALPVSHGVPCFAYSVSLARIGKFNADAAKSLGLPVRFWGILQRGENVSYEGLEYTPDMVLGASRAGLKVTYCTDSRPIPSISDFAQNSDLFVCEGLYGDPALSAKAAEHRHMTYKEAANIAKRANVSEMWLTHYSPSVTNPKEFLGVARDIFPNTHTGFDRKTATLKFSEDE
ncbi:ribonuclease Z [Clostridia bacterium]|nr:ribonuclease Z [Clostridia bacterium]